MIYKLVKETIKKLKNNRKNRSIYYFFHDIFWRIYWYINTLPLNIKSFYLRGKYGWSPKDTWDFDAYLSTVISQGLKHFKIYYHGRSPAKKELDIIIRGFEENLKMMNLDYKYKSKKYLLAEKKFHEGMKLFEKYFNYLWD